MSVSVEMFVTTPVVETPDVSIDTDVAPFVPPVVDVKTPTVSDSCSAESVHAEEERPLIDWSEIVPPACWAEAAEAAEAEDVSCSDEDESPSI
jgi:hypothetical protein